MKLFIELYLAFISYIRNRVSNRQFLVISAIMVGVTAGIAAVVLKTAVHYIQSFLTYDFKFRYHNYLYLIFPFIGILLTVFFIKYFLKSPFGKGASHILFFISKKMSLLDRETTYSHIVTSALTVGFGGSAGLEAPILVTGAAIGSNYGRINMFDYKDRTLLLACGSAAGIAAVFNAPIAGVMFAIEVLLSEATVAAIIPILISAASGALCSKILLQEKILFSFTELLPFNYNNVPYYIVLGLAAGIISLYYAKVFFKVESLFKKIQHKTFFKVLIGGLILGVLVFLFPPLFGEGYESIKLIATGQSSKLIENSILSEYSHNEWFLLIFIGVIIFIKAIATSVTMHSGGNGGNFAPSLFVGAFLGYFFSRFINLLNISTLPEANFTLVGMAGILSGVMYAPLTGIFLIAELTRGYDLMIPLMIVSSIAYIIVRHFEPYSMDTKDLARQGILHSANKDLSILSFMDKDEIIEKDFKTILNTSSLRELENLIAHSKRNIFPVVDKENNFLGIISLDNIREILFELESYEELLAIEFMSKSPVVIDYNEDLTSMMFKFDQTNAWNLPVLKDGKYVGFISKSTILTKYRKQLLENYREK
ncbi:MAG TPA: chloride channel protein [Ignavibacteriaceae bacterium]|nr:chloride channel protein [Ignavibacteriaceae bacterium]